MMQCTISKVNSKAKQIQQELTRECRPLVAHLSIVLLHCIKHKTPKGPFLVGGLSSSVGFMVFPPSLPLQITGLASLFLFSFSFRSRPSLW